MQETPHILGTLYFAESSQLLKGSYGFTCTPPQQSKFSLAGLDVETNTTKVASHISITDTDHALQINWLTLNNGLPENDSTIHAKLPQQWCGEHRWNHITAHKNRTGPYATIATNISRNAWMQTRLDSDLDGFTHTLAQLRPGPVHIVWITKAGGPFPVKSFKDIGTGETGGIKFRVDDLEYVLFQLESIPLETSPYAIATDPGIAVLRYSNNTLEGYWHITDQHTKVWK